MEHPVGLLTVHGRFQRGRRPFEGLWLRYVASGCLRLSALVSVCTVMCAAGLLFYLSIANICFSVSKIHWIVNCSGSTRRFSVPAPDSEVIQFTFCELTWQLQWNHLLEILFAQHTSLDLTSHKYAPGWWIKYGGSVHIPGHPYVIVSHPNVGEEVNVWRTTHRPSTWLGGKTVQLLAHHLDEGLRPSNAMCVILRRYPPDIATSLIHA